METPQLGEYMTLDIFNGGALIVLMPCGFSSSDHLSAPDDCHDCVPRSLPLSYSKRCKSLTSLGTGCSCMNISNMHWKSDENDMSKARTIVVLHKCYRYTSLHCHLPSGPWSLQEANSSSSSIRLSISSKMTWRVWLIDSSVGNMCSKSSEYEIDLVTYALIISSTSSLILLNTYWKHQQDTMNHRYGNGHHLPAVMSHNPPYQSLVIAYSPKTSFSPHVDTLYDYGIYLHIIDILIGWLYGFDDVECEWTTFFYLKLAPSFIQKCLIVGWLIIR